jgi:hypothetical protein
MWELAGVRWCLLNRDLDVDDVERIRYGRGWPRATLDGRPRAAGARPAALEVTGEELGRVGYASPVEPAVWLAICGVKAELAFAHVAASDLVGFFGFYETGRTDDADERVTRNAMAPGNRQRHISLVVAVDAGEYVRAAQLLVDRTWIADARTAPFATDRLDSSVRALVTEADADDVELLAHALAALPAGQLGDVLGAGPPAPARASSGWSRGSPPARGRGEPGPRRGRRARRGPRVRLLP